jgi:hypothetical protein
LAYASPTCLTLVAGFTLKLEIDAGKLPAKAEMDFSPQVSNELAKNMDAMTDLLNVLKAHLDSNRGVGHGAEGGDLSELHYNGRRYKGGRCYTRDEGI